jgi:hypothetical protein
MNEAEPLRMTLSDVAALAQVQRPVVSMWRKRSAASAHPFPQPAALDGGRELFDADQVGAGWKPPAAAIPRRGTTPPLLPRLCRAIGRPSTP